MPTSLIDRNGNQLIDPGLDIARGAYQEVTHINKFGTNHDVGTDYEDVWEQGDLWVAMPVATLVEVASTSTEDSPAGDGAGSLVIQGLDAAGLEIQDVVLLNGTTPVLSNLIFSFINRAFIYSVGATNTTGYNLGILYVADDSTTWGGTTAGVPDTAAAIQVHIAAEQGQTQQMIYTVPFDKTGYVTGGYIAADGSKVCSYIFYMTTRDTPADGIGVQRVAFEATVTGGSFIKAFHPYVQVPAGSSAHVEAKVDVGSASVSAGLDIVLIANERKW